ncbi:MAG: hypothetical protein INR64_12110 [Caulobacteraceae bacterium]|nr:hypothetical protein [Caulobacter sp.]
MRFPFFAPIALAAALIAPAAAHAQSGGTRDSAALSHSGATATTTDEAKASKGSDANSAKLTSDQITKGKADAPALLQAAGARCTMSNAAFRGSGDVGGKKADIYEAACSEGPGMLILAVKGAKPTAYPCLAVADQKTHCVLPENADPKAGLTSLATAAGRPCQVTGARYMGASTSTGDTYYELACQNAGGFRLGVPAGTAKPEAVDCLALLGTAQQCTLTTKAQALAGLQPLVQASGRPCQISDARFVGNSEANHATYYEVACGASGGFVIATDTSGKFQRAIDCSQAAGLGGGCTLTKIDPAQERAHYTQLAAAAGFQCQVDRDRLIGSDSTGRSAVEIACSNRPDGAIALFPTTPTGKTEIFDCIRAGQLGATCQLTQPTALYTKYTAALTAQGKTTCKVSNARYVGGLGNGGYVVETACSDGKPGWVIYFKPGPTPVAQQVLTCNQSANDGHACTLPGNKG